MSKRFFISAVLFFLSISCVFAASNPVSSEHFLGDYSLDFGKAKAGKVLKHEFKLKNLSKKTLEIKRVSTSCGCTLSKTDKKKLAPGESSLIKVDFDTKGYSGMTEQHVFIYIGKDVLPVDISIDEKTMTIEKQVIRIIIEAKVVK